MSTPRRRNDELLGTESIGPLLARMSVPAMVAMFVNALYNVVDTIFVGRGVGSLAIGGLTVAFPFQIFMMAISLMLGTGAASVISRALGAGDRERATRTAGTTIATAAVSGVILGVVGYTLSAPILRLFGASEQLLPYASEYLRTIVFGIPFITVTMASNHIIRSEGNARMAMAVMMTGAVLNIILDPIFIYGFGMGIRGAALATVIAQLCSFALAMSYFIRRRGSLEISARHLLISPALLGPVVVLGLQAFVRQFGGTFLSILVNNAAGAHGGDLAIASFGVINRILLFALMPIFGLAQGFQPIAGYNYGAGRFARVRQVTRLTTIAATVISTMFFALMVGIPRSLLGIFSSDAGLLEIAVPAMRTVVFVLPLVGVQVVGSTFFLAVGKAVPALFLGMLRQIILLIPLMLILPRLMGLPGVWTAFPIADGLAAAITLAWLALFMHQHLPRHPVAPVIAVEEE